MVTPSVRVLEVMMQANVNLFTFHSDLVVHLHPCRLFKDRHLQQGMRFVI